ncbi:hypothetical protein [uncultured Kriegella sp.]|uniref:Rieske (2Fe-2S) protein n=1 Tax=uncultured Kriegella sp. TaxID=1798910 RepID=UPI0030DA13AE|tara:strand:+ start:27180 stop:27617 length:438 start_codon:yes stop_codon:yes gene_type:complete
MKHFLIPFIILLLLSCSSDRTVRNPYLQEIGFQFELNLNLPSYSPLTNVGNVVPVLSQGVGNRGVFVINTGFDQFRVFEASCPNHAPNDCSTMDFEGQVATCSCEDYEYSLFTGQQLNRPDDGNRYYDMLEYHARANGNSVIISN